MVLGNSLFGMGPKKAATGDIDVFVRGVVQALEMETDAAQVAYRPVNTVDDLLLASQGGYLADWKRAILDASVLADTALWRFDFARPIAQDVVFTDSGQVVMDFNRTLEQQLVLQSLVVNKHSFFVVLSNILSLTEAVHQNLLVESLLDILLLEQSTAIQQLFLRSVSDNLSLVSQGSTATHFMRTLTDVITFDSNASLNGDFIRSVSSLLLIVDDAQYLYWIVKAITDVLSMTQTAIDQLVPGSPVTNESYTDPLSILDNLTFTTDYNRSIAIEIILNSIASSVSTYNQSSTAAIALAQALASILNMPRSQSSAMTLTQNGVYTLTSSCNQIDRDTINTTTWGWVQACLQNNATRTANFTETQENFGGSALAVGSNKYRGCVLAPNGYVYCIPHNSHNVLKLDVSGNTQTTVGASLSSFGASKWGCGALAKSTNYIISPPWNANAILTFNTSNDTAVTTGNHTGTIQWASCVCNKNGFVYGIPFSSTYMLGIDSANTSNTFNALTGCTGLTKWSGSGLYPDGLNLIMIPYTSTVLVKVNTGNTTTSPSTSNLMTGLTGDLKYIAGVIADNNCIYAIPYDSTNSIKINCGNDANTTFGSVSGGSKFGGGTLAWNQSILMPAFSSCTTNHQMIDTTNDTFYTTSANAGTASGKFTTGAISTNGKVILSPARELRAVKVTVNNANTSPTLNIITIPYLNKSH